MLRSILLFIGIYILSKGITPLLGTIIGEDVMRSTNYYYYNFFHWAYILPVGVICYQIYKSYLPKIRSEYRAAAAFCMLLLSLIILFIFIGNAPLSEKLYYLYVPLAGFTILLTMSPIAIVLLVLSLSLTPNRFIVNRFTRFFGAISYSLYLIHPFVIDPLKPAYLYIYDHTFYSTDLNLLLCIIFTLLIVTPISLLTYHLIETPGIRMGKKVMAKF